MIGGEDLFLDRTLSSVSLPSSLTFGNTSVEHHPSAGPSMTASSTACAMESHLRNPSHTAQAQYTQRLHNQQWSPGEKRGTESDSTVTDVSPISVRSQLPLSRSGIDAVLLDTDSPRSGEHGDDIVPRATMNYKYSKGSKVNHRRASGPVPDLYPNRPRAVPSRNVHLDSEKASDASRTKGATSSNSRPSMDSLHRLHQENDWLWEEYTKVMAKYCIAVDMAADAFAISNKSPEAHHHLHHHHHTPKSKRSTGNEQDKRSSVSPNPFRRAISVPSPHTRNTYGDNMEKAPTYAEKLSRFGCPSTLKSNVGPQCTTSTTQRYSKFFGANEQKMNLYANEKFRSASWDETEHVKSRRQSPTVRSHSREGSDSIHRSSHRSGGYATFHADAPTTSLRRPENLSSTRATKSHVRKSVPRPDDIYSPHVHFFPSQDPLVCDDAPLYDPPRGPTFASVNRDASTRPRTPSFPRNPSSERSGPVPQHGLAYRPMESIPIVRSHPGASFMTRGMRSRIERCFAPVVTPHMLESTVDSMVRALQTVLDEQNDAFLPSGITLQKVGRCVYSINGGKKIHLMITDHKLVVRTGGGHWDILEYLAKLPASRKNKVRS